MAKVSSPGIGARRALAEERLPPRVGAALAARASAPCREVERLDGV